MTQIIYSRKFENGLVLVAESMHSVESAAFTMRVPAGISRERADRGGVAAMTCDMVMRGAGQRDSRRLVQDLDNLGIERGESVGDSHTAFSGATMAKSLHAGLAIYADVLRRPHLPAEQFEAARSTALQELRAVEDEPAQKSMLELRRRHFPDPWGRPTQGSEASVRAMSLEDLREHFSHGYRPNGAILGVAGRIDWQELQDRVGELFGDWQPGPEAPVIEKPSGPKVDQLHHDSNQTHIAIAYESIPYRHPDYYQASGAIGVLSGGMSSRLFTEVREKRGLCYTVFASHHTLLDRGAVLCYAGTSAERAQETLDVTYGELLRLTDGIESSELDRLKARVKSALIMQQESTSARSSSLARDWHFLGRVRTLDEVAGHVDALTRESIDAYLRANPPRGFTILTLGPKPLEMPHDLS